MPTYMITGCAVFIAAFLNYRIGYRRATRRAARIASMFTMGPDASIYPGISWEETNPTARMAAHTTAQQIALKIRE